MMVDGSGGGPNGRLRPLVALLLLGAVFSNALSVNAEENAATTSAYEYSSPPPPVNPKHSHGKHHLKGATVVITCKAGYKEITAYGVTKDNGKFKALVEGYDYGKWGGAENCKAKLYKPPPHSSCNIPTNLHGGKTGAWLKYNSPPPPSPSSPPPYYYTSPPPPSPSPPPPYFLHHHPPRAPSPPPAYQYTSPPPPPIY
eukprot:Gb_33274 [translate_table: standard]